MKTALKQITLVGEGVHVLVASTLEEALQLAFENVEGKRIFAGHGSMRGILGGMFARPQAPSGPNMNGAYGSSVVIENGDASPVVFNTKAAVVALATVAAGVTARIWEKTVSPREMLVWGSGSYGAINNQGYLWFGISDKTTNFQYDTVRLLVERADRHERKVVDEFHDSETHLTDVTSLLTMTPSNNQTLMRALPMTNVIALPYSRMAIDITCEVAATTPDEAGFKIPISRKTG